MKFNDKTNSYLFSSIKLLKEIDNSLVKKEWCKNYSVYSKNENDIWNLENDLDNFFQETYDNNFVASNYGEIYDSIGLEDVYSEKLEKSKLKKLSEEQIVAIIAKEFRHDHFSEGCLINTYVAEGFLLYYMEELITRLCTNNNSIPINELL